MFLTASKDGRGFVRIDGFSSFRRGHSNGQFYLDAPNLILSMAGVC